MENEALEGSEEGLRKQSANVTLYDRYLKYDVLFLPQFTLFTGLARYSTSNYLSAVGFGASPIISPAE